MLPNSIIFVVHQCCACVFTVLLTWLGIGTETGNRALSGGDVISVTEVNDDIEAVSCSVLDDHVDPRVVMHYFEPAAWEVIIDLVARKTHSHIWRCGKCLGGLDDSTCEACRHWFHLSCCALKRIPKKKAWICSDCIRASAY